MNSSLVLFMQISRQDLRRFFENNTGEVLDNAIIFLAQFEFYIPSIQLLIIMYYVCIIHYFIPGPIYYERMVYLIILLKLLQSTELFQMIHTSATYISS